MDTVCKLLDRFAEFRVLFVLLVGVFWVLSE